MICHVRALSAILLAIFAYAPLGAAMQSSSTLSPRVASSVDSKTNSSNTPAPNSTPLEQPKGSEPTEKASTDTLPIEEGKDAKIPGFLRSTPVFSIPQRQTSLTHLSNHFTDLADVYPSFTSSDELTAFFDTLKDLRISGDVYADFPTTMATFKRIMMQELSADKYWVEQKGFAQQDVKSFNPFVQAIHIDASVEQTFLPISDIHGDGTAITTVLEDLMNSGKLSADYKLLDPTLYLVFLGDNSDRNPFGIEVWHIIMQLKIANPDHVFVLRGNHESRAQNKKLCDLFCFMSEVNHKLYAVSEDTIDNMYNHLPLALYVTNGQRTMLFCHGFADPCFDPTALLRDEKASYMRITSDNYSKEKFFCALSKTQQTTIIAAIALAQRQLICCNCIDNLDACIEKYNTITKDVCQHLDHSQQTANVVATICEKEQKSSEEFNRIKDEPLNAITNTMSNTSLLPHFEPLERCLKEIILYNDMLINETQKTEETQKAADAKKEATPNGQAVTTRSTTYQAWQKEATALRAKYDNLKKYLCSVMETDTTYLNAILPDLLSRPQTYPEVESKTKLTEAYPYLFLPNGILEHTLFDLGTAVPKSIDTTKFVWLDYDMQDYGRKAPLATHNSCMCYNPLTHRTSLGRELVHYTFRKHRADIIVRGHQHGSEAEERLTKAQGIHVSGKKNTETSYYLDHGDICTIVTGRGPWTLPQLDHYAYCTISLKDGSVFLEKTIKGDD